MKKQGDFISSLILVALGIFYLIYAFSYPWGSLANPGPGFLPVVAGVLFLLLSLRLTLEAIPHRSTSRADETSATTEESNRTGALKPIWIVVALAIYIYLLDKAGYLLSSFFLLLAAIKIIGDDSWWKPLLITVGLVIGTYLLFVVWLEVPLPGGHLIPIGGR
ncbi:MAG: hypothetical protein PWQ18_1459 [Clostridia bacterium]|nr:hypothetical protein [Clostridia bacterium]